MTTSSLIILRQLLDFFKPPPPAGRGECKEKGGKRSEKREHRKKKIKRKCVKQCFVIDDVPNTVVHRAYDNYLGTWSVHIVLTQLSYSNSQQSPS